MGLLRTAVCRRPVVVESGEVAEWSKAAVLKTVDRRRSQGSNPCLSAKINRPPLGAYLFLMAQNVSKHFSWDYAGVSYP